MTSDYEMKPGDSRRPLRGRHVFSAREWEALALTLGLSGREHQILQCVFDDEIEAVMAKALGISAHTVHTYVERLYRKLNVNSRVELLVRVFAEFRELIGNGAGARLGRTLDSE